MSTVADFFGSDPARIVWKIVRGDSSTISGGYSNTTSAIYSTISGGYKNTASSSYSAILGGVSNSTSTFACAMIVGSNITADRVCTTFVNNLSIKNVPIAATGLPSGAVWRCTVDNTLRIIP